ncbi:hypothetical protein TSOC_010379 [Tetrabaena socialis]|uniref:Uncharacterized protein n=1 Tax=Tetrabaena socialis TaxID=47790 RepID=A0A2J7ZTH0_9CHLO|nr:hypothetical protein TSOC_010379 [Tetrabaena socialis]|eukprot:PNH03566.1 hypothetical protein TSOC_010379 [Tetrabaena socialis]
MVSVPLPALLRARVQSLQPLVRHRQPQRRRRSRRRLRLPPACLQPPARRRPVVAAAAAARLRCLLVALVAAMVAVAAGVPLAVVVAVPMIILIIRSVVVAGVVAAGVVTVLVRVIMPVVIMRVVIMVVVFLMLVVIMAAGPHSPHRIVVVLPAPATLPPIPAATTPAAMAVRLRHGPPRARTVVRRLVRLMHSHQRPHAAVHQVLPARQYGMRRRRQQRRRQREREQRPGEGGERVRVLGRLAAVLGVGAERIRWAALYDMWTGAYSYATILVPSLLTAPRWDEATSALDGPTEGRLYALIRKRVGCYVSVGHRMQLLQHHTHVLECLGGGQWRFGSSADYQRRMAASTGLHP